MYFESILDKELIPLAHSEATHNSEGAWEILYYGVELIENNWGSVVNSVSVVRDLYCIRFDSI